MSTSLDPNARRRPVWRRWWFWSALLFFAVTVARGALRDAAATGSPAVPGRPAPSSLPAPTRPARVSAAPTPGRESDARAYAHRVRADLDVTTLEQLTAQMPDTLQPTLERRGQNRTLTWTFADGSQLAATFRPLGGEGSERGLVLYMVNIEE